VKTRNTTTKLFAMVMAVGMLAAIWTIWGASRAEAVIAIIRQTGVFSIAQGQATSRIVRSKALFCIVSPRTDKGFYVLFIPSRLPPRRTDKGPLCRLPSECCGWFDSRVRTGGASCSPRLSGDREQYRTLVW